MFYDLLVFRLISATGNLKSRFRDAAGQHFIVSRSRGNGLLTGSSFRRVAQTTQPQPLMESARQVAERTDALARTVKPGFTDYIRDVSQFRKFGRKLLVLAAEAQRE